MVDTTPRMVTHIDLTTSDIIVNIGCPSDGFPTDKVRTWGIPNFSEDPGSAFASLSEHVEALADSIT